jgi:ABC-2 type transport system permease protein
VLVPAVVIGVIALTLTSSTGLLAADLSRSALMMAAYGLYFLLFLALSLFVSAKAPSSRLALVILLAFWIINGLIATRGFSDLAGYLHPTPSAVEFAADLERDLADNSQTNKRLDEIRTRLLNQYGVQKVEELPVNFSGISLQAGEEHGNEVFDKHYGSLFAGFERQNGIYQLGGLVAPLLAVRSLSMGLAGTDFAQHRHFTIAAEDYRRMIQRVLNKDIEEHPAKAGQQYLASGDLWAKVPEFVYEAPSASWVLANYTTSILSLILWSGLTILIALAAARRLEV